MKLAALRPRSFRRLVSGIALVHAVGALAAGPSTELTITGAVRTPSTETAATLAARPAITQTDSFASGNSGTQTHTYTGASLWGTLDGAGIVVDPTVRNDVLNRFVVATGSDGYRVVMSLGELSPSFGARPDLIAYAEQSGDATVPLAADGFARIVVPNDVQRGRWVSNLVSLQVLGIPEPGTMALVFVGLLVAVRFGRRRFRPADSVRSALVYAAIGQCSNRVHVPLRAFHSTWPHPHPQSPQRQPGADRQRSRPRPSPNCASACG